MNKRITILLLLLLTLGLVGWGCLRKPATNQNDNQNLNQNINTNTATSTEEIDTSNWKTYRNKEYGFEVKYPERYEDETKFHMGKGENPKITKIYSNSYSWIIQYNHEVIIHLQIFHPDNWLKAINYYHHKIFNDKVKFNNQIGYKYLDLGTYDGFVFEGEKFIYTIYTHINNKWPKEFKDEYKKMVESFKYFK